MPPILMYYQNLVRHAAVYKPTCDKHPLLNICWPLRHPFPPSQIFTWRTALMLMSLTDAHWRGIWASRFAFNKPHMPERHLSNHCFEMLFCLSSNGLYALAVCVAPQGLIYILLHSQIKIKMNRHCSFHAEIPTVISVVWKTHWRAAERWLAGDEPDGL